MQKQPLYRHIMDYIQESIENGNFNEDEMLPSESELLEKFGFSRITVRKALDELEHTGLIYRVKGKGSFVSKRSEKKNEPDKGKIRKSDVITLLMPFGSSLGRSIDLIHGANEYLGTQGILLNVQNSAQDLNREKEILLNLQDSGVCGVILYPISDRKNIDIVNLLTMNNYPVVSVDKYFDGLPVDYIVSDNITGAYDATTYLIEKGHRNIGYISDLGLEYAVTVKNRFFGYCKALKDHGLEVNYHNYSLGYVHDVKTNHPDIYEILLNNKPLNQKSLDYFKRILDGFLDGRERITAIHTVNDYVAMHMMKTALDMGVKIPQELSLIGFDNIEISQFLDVPLTTIEQDFYQMGYKAAITLMKRISGMSGKEEKAVLPTKMVERDSVATLSAGSLEETV